MLESTFQETECIVTDNEIQIILSVKFFELYVHKTEEYAMRGRMIVIRIPYKTMAKEEELMNILRKKLKVNN